MLRAGVDLIKLMATGGVYTEGEEPGSPQLTVEEMQAAVERMSMVDQGDPVPPARWRGDWNEIIARGQA